MCTLTPFCFRHRKMRGEGIYMFVGYVVRLSVVRQHVFRVTRCLCSRWRDFDETWHGYLSCEWTLQKMFLGSKVKCQGHDQTECYNGGSVHFGDVACSIYTMGQKTAPLFSAITLSKRFILKWLLVHIYSNKFGTKRHQNHQSLLKRIFTVLCETQHASACSLPTSC